MREDIKSAIRSLRSSPTFTAVALVVLALGIGAGTAIFSVVDAVVLRGLPFDEHDRLAVVLEFDPTRADTLGGGTDDGTDVSRLEAPPGIVRGAGRGRRKLPATERNRQAG